MRVTPAAATAAGAIRSPVLVQPFIEEVRTRGEWPPVFIDGQFTHAVPKHPAPNDFRVQSHLGGRATRGVPPPAVLDAAARVLEALPLAPLSAASTGSRVRMACR